MIKHCLNLFLYCLILFPLSLQAEIVDTFQFNSSAERVRAVELAKSLRCPQCQNQNLVESNSPIAYDLRLEVYRMVNEGKSNAEIVQIMTDRFGNFVLYKPPLHWKTALLWLMPIVLLVFALSLMWRYLKKQRSPQTTILLDTEQQALLQLLNKSKSQ